MKFDQHKFTKEAWEAIISAWKIADCVHQKIETEHLMKALLEQKHGLVPLIFAEVSIDSTYILNITEEFIKYQPKDIGESMGSVLGLELEALLQRAMEWKEECGDFLVSTEHLLLSFNLDNRIGKYVYREGKSVDIALNILDAIEVVRKAQLSIMNQEENREVLKNCSDVENQEDIDAQVMEVSKVQQCSEVMNKNAIASDNLIDCNDDFGKIAVGKSYDGTKVSTWNCLAAYLAAKLNIVGLRNGALTVFDEMSKRENFLCKAMIHKNFESKKLDSTIGLMKKENIWTTLSMFIQNPGLYAVELFHEKLNASKDMINARYNLMGVSLKATDQGWWEHCYLEENGSSYDCVLRTTMACVGAVQVIHEAPRKDILGWITTIPSDVPFEQGKKAHHYFNHLPHKKIKPNEFTLFVFDPGGSEANIGTLILEDKDCFKGVGML